ncbi:MAG TPA: 30S ribosomal protein S16 [Candidatus Paceibacterota bacterium]
MLSIRLQRVGRKHEPLFRLVLTDSKNSTKSGKFLEILGSYDARRSEKAEFNNEKVLHWISKGAQPSDTVHNLLLKRSLIKGEKRNVLSRKPVPPKAEEVTPVVEAPVLEAVVEAPVATEEVVPPETALVENVTEEVVQ